MDSVLNATKVMLLVTMGIPKLGSQVLSYSHELQSLHIKILPAMSNSEYFRGVVQLNTKWA